MSSALPFAFPGAKMKAGRAVTIIKPKENNPRLSVLIKECFAFGTSPSPFSNFAPQSSFRQSYFNVHLISGK